MIKPGDGYSAALEANMHRTIKKVTSDFEKLKFNTAIAAMMSLVNDFYKENGITKSELETLLILLNPVAPHITEEMYSLLGHSERIYQAKWPEYDEAKTVENEIEIAVQFNGKVKAQVKVGTEDTQEVVREKVMALDAVTYALNGKTIVKEIYVKGRIYNIVVK